MEPWGWLAVAAVALIGWPFAVFYTAAFWGAGLVSGELKYLEAAGKLHAQRGGKDGDESGT